MLNDNLAQYTSRPVLENFLAGTYLLDAVYTACRSGIPSALYRLSDLAPDNYFASDFYNSADFHPCISDKVGSLAEEIVYVARRSNGACLVLSLMRAKGLSRFTESEFSELRSVTEIVVETMIRHWPPQPSEQNAEPAPQGSDVTLERAFSSFSHELLSPREQTIVSLLLRGHSTLSVAHNLDIAEGTVKVHRKHIYGKLGISSQAELFLMFCSHIIQAQNQVFVPTFGDATAGAV